MKFNPVIWVWYLTMKSIWERYLSQKKSNPEILLEKYILTQKSDIDI